MSEEQISSTGQFAALGAVDAIAAYQSPGNPAPPGSSAGTSAVPAPQARTESVPQKAAAATPASAPTSEEIAKAVAAANANLAGSDRQLDYRVDAATGITIALIRNSQTGVVLQQVPGADIIALARMLADWSPGKHMLLDLIA